MEERAARERAFLEQRLREEILKHENPGGYVGALERRPSGASPPQGEETIPQPQPRPQRRHRHHHRRMRMHDGNVRRLIDCDLDTPESCSCDVAESQDRLGQWGTVHPPKPTQGKPKKSNPNAKRGGRSYGGSAGPVYAMREQLREEDNFRFRHYEDVSLFIEQYRQENTICIQGADPSGPPVLGRDTPDPYLAKLRQCGDLLERLVAFTAMARQQAEDQDPSRHPDRPLTKAVQYEKTAREYSGASSPDLTSFSFKGSLPRKAVNLAPIRDCRLSVTNIRFPQERPPKRQPGHIQQQQAPAPAAIAVATAAQQQTLSQNPLSSDLQSPRVAFPLPVRIVVNSETLKGNKLSTLSPPLTPTRRRRLSRSESTDRQPPQRPANNIHVDPKFAKKRSEGDIRCPPLATASASDLSFSDPSIYDQYLAQRKRIGMKEETTGHLLFAKAAGSSKGSSTNGGSSKREKIKPPTIGLCELYSSGSGTLITAVNNR